MCFSCMMNHVHACRLLLCKTCAPAFVCVCVCVCVCVEVQIRCFLSVCRACHCGRSESSLPHEHAQGRTIPLAEASYTAEHRQATVRDVSLEIAPLFLLQFFLGFIHTLPDDCIHACSYNTTIFSFLISLPLGCLPNRH